MRCLLAVGILASNYLPDQNFVISTIISTVIFAIIFHSIMTMISLFHIEVQPPTVEPDGSLLFLNTIKKISKSFFLNKY